MFSAEEHRRLDKEEKESRIMILLPNFNTIEVIQRDKELGCIPSSIEWLLKFHQIDTEVNSPKNWAIDFQEKILLGLNNNQPSFTSAIKITVELFPYFKDKLIYQSFKDSINKIEKIKDLIESENGCLISVAYPGWIFNAKKDKTPDEHLSMLNKGQIEELMHEVKMTNLSFHIMPVVGYTDSNVILLDLAKTLNDQKIEMKWSKIEMLHKFIAGGNDLCYLKR